MSRPKFVGDVVSNCLRIAPWEANPRLWLYHGALRAARAGISPSRRRRRIAYGLDVQGEREDAIARLEAGQSLVLVSRSLLSFGVDIPCVECIVLARTTRSLSCTCRPADAACVQRLSNEHCMIIDHGRSVETPGLPHEDFAWSLTPAGT